MYMVTVLGNLGLITLIGLNSHLHTPMYFFLFNLSFIDLCFSSVFTPKMLMNFVSKKNIISYMGCMTQLYFFSFLSFLNATCWHQWPMIAMWPSVSHCCITLPCPVQCVLGLFLVHTRWRFLAVWLTLDACWDCPSVMQIPSTTTSVTSSLCSSSPAPAPTSMRWWFSSWWASTSLCPVSPSLSHMVSSSPASFASAPQKAGPKPSAPAFPTSLLFLCSLDQVYLCISNHLPLSQWMREKYLLSFILMWFPWWTP